MKLFTNIYTALSIDEVAFGLKLNHWHMEKIDEEHYEFSANNVTLNLEGKSEFLLFGQLNLPLEEVDQWVAGLRLLPVSFALDIHGDEARLIRRYHQ